MYKKNIVTILKYIVYVTNICIFISLRTMNGYLDKSSTILSSPHADKVTRLVYDLLWRGVRGQVQD